MDAFFLLKIRFPWRPSRDTPNRTFILLWEFTKQIFFYLPFDGYSFIFLLSSTFVLLSHVHCVLSQHVTNCIFRWKLILMMHVCTKTEFVPCKTYIFIVKSRSVLHDNCYFMFNLDMNMKTNFGKTQSSLQAQHHVLWLMPSLRIRVNRMDAVSTFQPFLRGSQLSWLPSCLCMQQSPSET